MSRLGAWLVVRRRKFLKPDPICARSRAQMPAARITAPAQEMTRKIGPSYRSIIAHKLARGLDLMSQVLEAAAGGAGGPLASSELDAQALRQFADDAAAEQQHANHENHALDDVDPLAHRGQIILQ